MGSGSCPGTPESRAPGLDSQSSLASLAWWHPGTLGFSTHTLIAIIDKNATGLSLCQEKLSVRLAPRLHCSTKSDFRMSHRAAAVALSALPRTTPLPGVRVKRRETCAPRERAAC